MLAAIWFWAILGLLSLETGETLVTIFDNIFQKIREHKEIQFCDVPVSVLHSNQE